MAEYLKTNILGLRRLFNYKDRLYLLLPFGIAKRISIILKKILYVNNFTVFLIVIKSIAFLSIFLTGNAKWNLTYFPSLVRILRNQDSTCSCHQSKKKYHSGFKFHFFFNNLGKNNSRLIVVTYFHHLQITMFISDLL